MRCDRLRTEEQLLTTWLPALPKSVTDLTAEVEPDGGPKRSEGKADCMAKHAPTPARNARSSLGTLVDGVGDTLPELDDGALDRISRVPERRASCSSETLSALMIAYCLSL